MLLLLFPPVVMASALGMQRLEARLLAPRKAAAVPVPSMMEATIEIAPLTSVVDTVEMARPAVA
jgi:hypothetical protein